MISYNNKNKIILMLSKFADEDSSLNMPGIAKVWTFEEREENCTPPTSGK